MFAPIIGSTVFHQLQVRFDRDLADQVRVGGCPKCSGVLDRADYERKPRGGPSKLANLCKTRRSLCCRRDGCRSRCKPPSVVFLDRRVYLGAVVVLISALAEGATERRMRSLRAVIGASAPTIRRWQKWWREAFPRTDLGRLLRARLGAQFEADRLPRNLLEFSDESLVGRVVWVQKLLAGLQAL